VLSKQNIFHLIHIICHVIISNKESQQYENTIEILNKQWATVKVFSLHYDHDGNYVTSNIKLMALLTKNTIENLRHLVSSHKKQGRRNELFCRYTWLAGSPILGGFTAISHWHNCNSQCKSKTAMLLTNSCTFRDTKILNEAVTTI